MDLIGIMEKYAKYFVTFNIILMLIFSSFLIYKKVNYGYIFEKDVSLEGGILIGIPKNINIRISDLKALEFDNSIYNLYETENAIYLEAKEDFNVTNFISFLNEKYNLGISENDLIIQTFDPFFSKTIFDDFVKFLSIALILIATVIFIIMREKISSLVILLTITFDLLAVSFILALTNYEIIAIAFVALLMVLEYCIDKTREKISSLVILLTITFDLLAVSFILALTNYEISTIAFVALLMVLGYGIDNNIVLATNILKETGEFKDKVKSALKIGYMMELTTLIVLLIIYFIIESNVIKEFSFILSIALLFDMYFYLFGNIPLYKILLLKS